MPLRDERKKKNLSLEGIQETRDISDIFDYLYLGGSNSVIDFKELRDRRVTHIINCTKCSAHDQSCQLFSDFVHLRLEVDDEPSADITSSFGPSFKMIEEARQNGGACLVHCKKGMSRSATIVLGYMIAQARMTAIDALKYLQSKRALVSPNTGFMAQLLALEKSVHGANSIDYDKYKRDRFASADSLRVGGVFPRLNRLLSPRSPSFFHSQRSSSSDRSEEIGWIEPTSRHRERARTQMPTRFQVEDVTAIVQEHEQYDNSKRGTFKRGFRRLKSLPGFRWTHLKASNARRAVRIQHRMQTVSPSEATSMAINLS